MVRTAIITNQAGVETYPHFDVRCKPFGGEDEASPHPDVPPRESDLNLQAQNRAVRVLAPYTYDLVVRPDLGAPVEGKLLERAGKSPTLMFGLQMGPIGRMPADTRGGSLLSSNQAGKPVRTVGRAPPWPLPARDVIIVPAFKRVFHVGLPRVAAQIESLPEMKAAVPRTVAAAGDKGITPVPAHLLEYDDVRADSRRLRSGR